MAADIVLEEDSIRATDVFNVATNETSPEVEIDPENNSITLPSSYSSITAGSATLQGSGALELHGTEGEEMVRASSSQSGGSLVFSSADSDAQVRITTEDANGALTMDAGSGATDIVQINTENDTGEMALSSSLGPETVTITADTTGTEDSVDYRTGGGGIVLRHKRTGNKQVTAETTASSGGQLTVRSAAGKRTCTLNGDDAALVLAGMPENNYQDRADSGFGGGELVLQQGVSQGDIQIHAKGERDSDYGTDGPRNHRPRILLDGPRGTLELGRPMQGSNAEAVSGRLFLRGLKSRAGRPLFEANAVDQRAKQNNGWRRSEAIFRFSDSPDYVLDRGGGAIRAFENGLMLYAGGQKVLFVRDDGNVLVRGQIETGVGSGMP